MTHPGALAAAITLLTLPAVEVFSESPPAETPGSAALARPTAGQVAFQEMGFGLFVHWSPSVYEGSEGDSRKTPRERINPDRFDAEQIVRAAQSCDAGYVVFVAKHVGGYCAWQTETTDYSLKTSPWKGGRGDMVGELAAACRKAGLKFGVYLCPRDDDQQIGNGGKASTPEKQPAVDAFYRRQLTELLTRYGTLFEVWFDGGNRVPVNDLLDQHAPEVVTFQGRRPGSSRWVGTEYGHAPYPCWNTVAWKVGEVPAQGAGICDGNLWAPAECDVSILRPRWFWSPGCDAHVLSLEALIGIYYLSVGRSANLLLNIAPDDHGAVPEAQLKRLAEFGADIRARFGAPLATTSGTLGATTGSVALAFDGTKTVDHVRLREVIRGGERARRFKVRGRQPDGAWVTLAAGSQIGARQIIPLPPVEVTELKLDIMEAAAPVSLQEFAAFHVARPVPAQAYRAGAHTAMRAPVLERSRDGHFALDCPDPEWDTRYTLDGSEPTAASPIYREPLPLPAGGLVKARYFDRTDPAAAPGPVLVRRLGLPASRVQVLHVSSEDRAGRGGSAFDADRRTLWHTAWRPAQAGFPHELVLDLGETRAVAGLTCLPRQDARGNQPSFVRIFVSDRADDFPAQPQFEGAVGTPELDPQAWREAVMPSPAAGRFVKLVFTAVASNGPCLAAAEMEILVN